jgi:hypothetical protein
MSNPSLVPCQAGDQIDLVECLGQQAASSPTPKVVSVQTDPSENCTLTKPKREKTVPDSNKWIDEVWITRCGKKYGPYRRLRWRDACGKMRSRYLGKAESPESLISKTNTRAAKYDKRG